MFVFGVSFANNGNTPRKTMAGWPVHGATRTASLTRSTTDGRIASRPAASPTTRFNPISSVRTLHISLISLSDPYTQLMIIDFVIWSRSWYICSQHDRCPRSTSPAQPRLLSHGPLRHVLRHRRVPSAAEGGYPPPAGQNFKSLLESGTIARTRLPCSRPPS